MLVCVLSCLAVIAAAGAAWAYGATHPLLPGLRGCDFVRDGGAQQGCYSDAIDSLVADRGVAVALPVVEAAARTRAPVRSACHMAMHGPGERTGRRDARTGGEARIPDQPEWCGQGYSHGYVVGYFGADGPMTGSTLARAAGSCDVAGRDGRVDCVHALGHLFAKRGVTAAAAVRPCRDLVGARAALAQLGEECMYGAYMEAAMSAPRSGDPVDSCRGATGDAATACHRFLPGQVLLMGGDLADARQACERVDDDALRGTCVTALVERSGGDVACGSFARASDRDACHRLRVASGDVTEAEVA